MKKRVIASVIGTLFIAAPISIASAGYGQSVSVSITNISTTVLTPPIVITCKHRVNPIATIGAPASSALEALAEGGDTSGLMGYFESKGCNTAQGSAPILPGETATLEVAGRNNDFLHMAAMVLPTNDGFVYTSGYKVRQVKHRGRIRLKAFDAGTEFNDEHCANIPGPQCGGEGFNATREANNFVRPHPGLHGGADVSAADYNWGNPLAIIRVN